MPKLPQLNYCCCGCSLDTGVRIIAWLEVVGGLLTVIGMALLSTGVVPKTWGKGEEDKNLPALIMIIIIYVMAIVLGIILLIGITKKRISNVRIWVMVKSVLVVLYVTYYLVLLGLWAFSNGHPVTYELIPPILEVYFLMVVHSYYRDMQSSPGTV